MASLESQLLATVTRRFKRLAGEDPTLRWRKRHGGPMGVAGDPDIYGVWNGTHFEMELKRPGESPTLLQLARLSEWAKAGCRTFVIHNLLEFDRAIEILRPAVYIRTPGGASERRT